MPYYHLYVITKEKRHFLTNNFSEKELEGVVEAHRENKPFMHGGRVYEPSNFDKITVFKSDRKFRDLILPNGRSSVGQGAAIVAKYFKAKKVAGVSIVTNQFFKVPPRHITGKETSEPIDKTKVFIVHGTDHNALKELRSIIKETGLNPIILHEQPGGSMTIIEKLEACSKDIGFAFVLLTPDDALLPAVQKFDINMRTNAVTPVWEYAKDVVFRARQNVLLEFGYFIAKIGRRNVVCLYKENTELPFDRPSDMHGIVYTPFKVSVNEVKERIKKELKAAGYDVKE
jgi:predicted nucleotide-binding protein